MNGISIFIDESGDLGLDFEKMRTQPFFIVGALVCRNAIACKEIQKATERTLKNKLNRKPKDNRYIAELKGSRTDIKSKKYFYSQCQHNPDWALYFAILNKKSINKQLRSRDGKHRLYNFLAKELVDNIKFDPADHIVNLYLDKCKGSQEEEEFDSYIKTHIETKLSLKTRLNCYHLNSITSKGIQAIDMFLAGVYEKYNFHKDDWYDVFKDKIEFEDIYLK